MAEKMIVIWDADKIERGFVADLFHAAGYRIVLVDESPALIAQLNTLRKGWGWVRRVD